MDPFFVNIYLHSLLESYLSLKFRFFPYFSLKALRIFSGVMGSSLILTPTAS